MRQIVTTLVYPPIPIRCFDWAASFDGDEPNDRGQMLCGHGVTEKDACLQLIQMQEELDDDA